MRDKSAKDNNHVIEKFNSSTREIIKSIRNQTPLEGVNIADKVQDPNFRFMSNIKADQEYSREISEAIATVARLIKTRDTQAAIEKSIEKRIETADEFAAGLYPVIKKIQVETGIVTNKGTAKLLNDNKVSTFKEGGHWHTSTINNMKKRWHKLGLDT